MPHTVSLIDAPFHHGTTLNEHTGVAHGPARIRDAGLTKKLEHRNQAVIDRGTIPTDTAEAEDIKGAIPGEAPGFMRKLAAATHDSREEDTTPLVLGGDHSIAIGTVNGTSQTVDSMGLVWLDAHTDFNTPASSPTGNFHGMPVAALLGDEPFNGMDWAHAESLAAENTVIVGARQVDKPEWERLADSPVTVYTMHDIIEHGILAVIRDAFQAATQGVDGVHLSLDMDWYNPGQIPGVGTPATGGVSEKEGIAALHTVHNEFSNQLLSMDVSEVNPGKDEQGETARLAADSAAVALGGHAYTAFYDEEL